MTTDSRPTVHRIGTAFIASLPPGEWRLAIVRRANREVVIAVCPEHQPRTLAIVGLA